MDGAFEFFLERAGVFSRDARDEHRLSVFQKFRRDFDNLFRRLAGAENDFGEIFAERAVRVHLGKAEVSHRRGLEGAQDFFARNFSGAKLVQQLRGFNSCHRWKMPRELPAVTREIRCPKI